MRQKLMLLPLFVFSLLIVACSGSSQQIGSTSVTHSPVAVSSPTPSATIGITHSPVAVSSPGPNTTIRVTLEAVPGQGTPSSAQMQAAGALLSERLAAYGFKNAQISQVTLDNQPALQVDVPHFSSNQSGTLEALLVTGQVEFWSTGATPVQTNAFFDPTQYIQNNNGSTSALFTNADLDASKIFVGQDQTGLPEINLAMKSSAAGRFFTFTQQNVGQYLTITLDRKVIMSAVIQSAINGPFVITGSFTTSQANITASIIKYSALPVALRISSEQTWNSGG